MTNTFDFREAQPDPFSANTIHVTSGDHCIVRSGTTETLRHAWQSRSSGHLSLCVMSFLSGIEPRDDPNLLPEPEPERRFLNWPDHGSQGMWCHPSAVWCLTFFRRGDWQAKKGSRAKRKDKELLYRVSNTSFHFRFRFRFQVFVSNLL